MKLVFQEPHPFTRTQEPRIEPKSQAPYIRSAGEPLLIGPKPKPHRTALWNAISNPAALVKDPGPTHAALLTKAAAPLKSLLPEDRNTNRIEELIEDKNKALNGTELANSILQQTFGHHISVRSNDPQGLRAYQAATQMVAAASEVPSVQDALRVLGSGTRGTITLDVRDIDKFLKDMSSSDGAQIHGEPSWWKYKWELVKYGTPYNIHHGLNFFSKPTQNPSALTPQNPLEKLGVVLGTQAHLDAKTIQNKSPEAMQTLAYHVTKMVYGPEVASGAAAQLKTKFLDGLIQKGLFLDERASAVQNGTKIVWRKPQG